MKLKNHLYLLAAVIAAVGLMITAASAEDLYSDKDLPSEEAGAQNLAQKYIVSKDETGSAEIAQGYLLAGIKQYRSGEYKKALKNFAYSYRLDPENETTKEYLIRTRDILIDKGVLDLPRSQSAQITHDKKVHKEKVQSVKEVLKDGVRLMKLGRLYDAEEKFLEAKEILPYNSKVNELLKKTREMQILREMRDVEDKVDVENTRKIAEVSDTWLQPSIPTDRDEIYYNQQLEKVDIRDLLREKASRRIISKIDFQDANLKDVLRFLSEQGDINIIIDEKALPQDEKVTVFLKDIPLLEALKLILSSKGLTYRVDKGFIWVTTERQLRNEPLVMEIYDVQDLLGRLYDFPSAGIGPEKDLAADAVTDKDDEKDKKRRKKK